MPESLNEVLRGRVRARTVKTQTSYQIDLRGPAMGDLGQLTMRLPGVQGWPKQGPTITSEDVAMSDLVIGAYAEHVKLHTKPARSSGGRVKTVDEACDDLLSRLLELPRGKEQSTFINCRSAIVHHILPRWSGQPITALLPEPVLEWLEKLEVTKQKDCVKVSVPASLNQKKHVRYTLGRVWHEALPLVPPPFAGIVLRDSTEKVARAEAARTGEPQWERHRSSYNPSEVLRVAACGWALDQLNIADMPNVRCRVNPLTAEAAIWSVALVTRIQELMNLRRRHINLELGLVWIPGTKTANAPRHMIITDSFRPWVERRLAAMPEDPNAFVFQVDPRVAPSAGAKGPSRKTYGARLARAEAAAGLKFEREATHLFRDTAITWMTAEGIDERLLKVLVGHGDPLRGITSAYLSPELFLQLVLEIQRDVRRHLAQLPTPEQVASTGAELLVGMRAERADRQAQARVCDAVDERRLA